MAEPEPTWTTETTERICAVADVIERWLRKEAPAAANALFRSDLEELAELVWPHIAGHERQRAAQERDQARAELLDARCRLMDATADLYTQRQRTAHAQQERDQARAEGYRQAAHDIADAIRSHFTTPDRSVQQCQRIALHHAEAQRLRAALEHAAASTGSGPRAGAPGPQDMPADWLLALLRQVRDEQSLDVADAELIDHHRTEGYRRVIHAAYRVGYAAALGHHITVAETGDAVLIGDQPDPR